MPLLMAPARSGQGRRVDWSLIAYSGGTGIVTAAVVTVAAWATAGLDEVLRLAIILGAALATVVLAVERVEQSMRAVGAVRARVEHTLSRLARR